jgi:hypothetical protein
MFKVEIPETSEDIRVQFAHFTRNGNKYVPRLRSNAHKRRTKTTCTILRKIESNSSDQWLSIAIGEVHRSRKDKFSKQVARRHALAKALAELKRMDINKRISNDTMPFWIGYFANHNDWKDIPVWEKYLREHEKLPKQSAMVMQG